MPALKILNVRENTQANLSMFCCVMRTLLSTSMIVFITSIFKDLCIYFVRRVFNPLITLEAEYDKKMKESISCPVRQVKWDVKSANKVFNLEFETNKSIRVKVHATFQLPGFRDGSEFA